jgi:hypothetical protein
MSRRGRSSFVSAVVVAWLLFEAVPFLLTMAGAVFLFTIGARPS